MRIQNSFRNKEGGTLYVVPTPIGNLDDMTFRAIRTLKEVRMIAAEDTRQTRKLLNHFEIENELISYHEHNIRTRNDQLIRFLEQNEDIALVSDAGMPAISDPGMELVQACIKRNLNVVVLPGANAALCALVGSGLSTNEFLFYGFLPRKKREKVAELNRLKTNRATLLFYESPHRLKETIVTLREVLGNRDITIAREITKLYEQYIRGSLESVADWLMQNDVKGECCIVVEGSNDDEEDHASLWWGTLTVAEHVRHYEETEGIPHKEALRKVASDRGTSRRVIYEQIHVKEKKHLQ